MANAHYTRKEAPWKKAEKRQRKENVKNFITYFVVFFIFLGTLTYVGNIFKTAIIAVYYGVIGGGETITSANYCSFRQALLSADWARLCIKAVIISMIAVHFQNKNYVIRSFTGGILAFVTLFLLLELLDWAAYMVKFLLLAGWVGITTFQWEITIKNILMDYNLDFLSRFGQVSVLYGLMKFIGGESRN